MNTKKLFNNQGEEITKKDILAYESMYGKKFVLNEYLEALERIRKFNNILNEKLKSVKKPPQKD